MSHLKLPIAIGLAICLTACKTITLPWQEEEASLIVQTTSGLVQGQFLEETGIAHFAGVPFAAPTVGTLRWAAPEPVMPWSGVRPAMDYGPECLQNRSQNGGIFVRAMIAGMGFDDETRDTVLATLSNAEPPIESEDCLYLNIRTANLGAKKKQPVMVWIHGGSHRSGAGSRSSYASNTFVKRGIVYVTINYRLGALGYLSHPALSADAPDGASGNYGLLDQIAALQWIKDNIDEFGGDPDNVTIFGESAGSQSVSELMASPLAKGLFHKGILQSGASSNNHLMLKRGFNGRASTEEAGLKFLEGVGLAEPGANAADLRSIPAEAIIAAQPKAGSYGVSFLPTAGGPVLPKTIGEIILNHEAHDVPTLIGYNSDEGSLFYLWMRGPMRFSFRLPKDPEERLDALRELYAPDGMKLIGAYGMGDPETRAAGEAEMLGDDMFGVHARFLAKEQAARGAPTYFYHFTRTPPSPDQTVGAYHAAEIPFVFDLHTLTRTDDPKDAALTKAMGDYWANFAKTGDPNGKGLAEWQKYDGKRDNWLILDHEIKMEDGRRKEKLDFQEALLRRLIEEVSQN